MAFAEGLKQAVRRKAHFRCCLCHSVGIEVHHVVPSGEGGSDDEDNAAPLCPSCHEVYGANPMKRKFIKEARDFWFEVCAARFITDAAQVEELTRVMKAAATKQDLELAVKELTRAVGSTAPTALDNGITTAGQLATLLSEPLTEDSLRRYLRALFPTGRHCGPEEVRKLTGDLLAVGYANIGGLHSVMDGVSEAFADVVLSARDRGEPTDDMFDSRTLRLFLPIFDQRYCRTYYPKVCAKILDGTLPGHWRRPEVSSAA